MRTSMHSRSGSVRRGFTLVELLVVIGIIAVLIGVLLPALSKARQQSNSLWCLSNLRTFGQAINMYAASNQGRLPISYWDGFTDPNKTGTDWPTGDWHTSWVAPRRSARNREGKS